MGNITLAFGDAIEIDGDYVLVELDGVFNFPNPGAIRRQVLETVFGDDNDYITGALYRIKNGFEVISGSEASGVKEHTGVTKAALGQLVFCEFSFNGTALAAVTDKDIVYDPFLHLKIQVGNPLPSSVRSFPYRSGI